MNGQIVPMPADGGSPIRIGAAATVIDPGSASRLAELLGDTPAIVLHDVLDPAFSAMLTAYLERSERIYQGIDGFGGGRWVEGPPQAASNALRIALGRASTLRWLEQVARCGPLSSAGGEFAEASGPGDFLPWHDDRHEPLRKLALTIHFPPGGYRGGAFEMRDAATKRLLLRHSDPEPGSALLFRISNTLEHQLCPIESGGKRRVFAGSWSK